MNKTHIYIILFSLVILAAGLQFLAASQTSFWLDEAWTAKILQKGPESLESVISWDIHPPLLMFSLSFWGNIFGYDEIGLRSFSIVLSCLALFVVFKFTSELFDDKTGLLAVALLVFSPLYVLFAHNARYYSMAMLLVILAAYATYKYLDTKRYGFILIYLLSSVLMLYLVLGTIAVIVACNLWVVIVLLQKKTRSLNTLILWIGAQALLVVSYLPGLGLFSSDASKYTTPVILGNWLVETAKRVIYLGFTFSLGETLSPLNPAAWVGAVVIVFVAIYAILVGRKDNNFWLPILFLFVIGAASVGISLVSDIFIQTWQNMPRWAFFGLPFLMMWLGFGLSRMKTKVGLLAGIVLLFVYCTGIFNYYAGKQFLQPIYAVPWRTIFADIQSNAHPDALILCNGSSEQAACRYYGERFDLIIHTPADWNKVEPGEYPEVWWVQVNMGTRTTSESSMQILDEITGSYQGPNISNYALHDPSIRWLKVKMGQQEDYEYRVNVYSFFNP